jgi:alkylated DNA repair dioxygenase AlkB
MNSPLLPDLQYTTNFVPGPSTLFERARRELAWDTRLRLRHTASTGLAYNYSGIVYPDCPMPDFLRELADAISVTVAHPITNCLANLYEGEESRMGFHSDSAAGIVPRTSTSIISLGGERNLTFRSKDPQRRTINVRLEHGSLLVMRASVQELWTHALLPEPGAAPRISLTFRFVAQAPDISEAD